VNVLVAIAIVGFLPLLLASAITAMRFRQLRHRGGFFVVAVLMMYGAFEISSLVAQVTLQSGGNFAAAPVDGASDHELGMHYLALRFPSMLGCMVLGVPAGLWLARRLSV
jgi:ABC-type proline/glycine betaine transport system permease subunit